MIGISSACFYPINTEDTLPIIKDMGFGRIEVFINSNQEFSLKNMKELKVYCDDNGMKINSIHPFTSFAEPTLFFSNYQRRYEDGIELYKKYFYNSASICAKYFVFHGALSVQRISVERYAEIFYDLSIFAKCEGITLCQENVSRCICGKKEYLFELDKLLGDNINYTLDLKQANRLGYNPIEFIDGIGQKIKLCHINDFDGNYECLLPCMGNFDFKEFKSKMDSNNYKGDYIIEVYSDNYNDYKEIEKSKTLLENIIN